MATATLERPRQTPVLEGTTLPRLPRVVSPEHVSPDAYLAQERVALTKHEYIDGVVREMPGASLEHNIVTGNLITVLNLQLWDRDGFFVLPSDLRIRIPNTNRFTYPDVVVVSGEEPRFTDDAVDTVLNPTVLFEVLSESTEAYDRGKKFASYQTIPSLQQYVLVSQDEPRIEIFTRDTDGEWKYNSVHGLENIATLRSIGTAIALKDVYRKIPFPVTPPTPAGPEAAETEIDTPL